VTAPGNSSASRPNAAGFRPVSTRRDPRRSSSRASAAPSPPVAPTTATTRSSAGLGSILLTRCTVPKARSPQRGAHDDGPAQLRPGGRTAPHAADGGTRPHRPREDRGGPKRPAGRPDPTAGRWGGRAPRSSASDRRGRFGSVVQIEHHQLERSPPNGCGARAGRATHPHPSRPGRRRVLHPLRWVTHRAHDNGVAEAGRHEWDLPAQSTTTPDRLQDDQAEPEPQG